MSIPAVGGHNQPYVYKLYPYGVSATGSTSIQTLEGWFGIDSPVSSYVYYPNILTDMGDGTNRYFGKPTVVWKFGKLQNYTTLFGSSVDIDTLLTLLGEQTSVQPIRVWIGTRDHRNNWVVFEGSPKWPTNPEFVKPGTTTPSATWYKTQGYWANITVEFTNCVLIDTLGT